MSVKRRGDRVEGVVSRVLRSSHEEDVGLIVDIPGPAFVPRSLLRSEDASAMEKLVGRLFTGLVYKVDSDRNTVIIQPFEFGDEVSTPTDAQG